MIGTVKRKPVILINRKNPKKKKKRVLIADREEPEHNFMKYYKVIKYWAKRNYNLTEPDLEMLFFLHDERLFKQANFEEYNNIFSWDSRRFQRLMRNGMIHVWRKPMGNEARLYELTRTGKRLITRMYQMMLGNEPIPTSPRRNTIFSSKRFSDKVYAMAINKFNEEIKAPKQHLDTESSDT
jgi:predicted transcriptional regulator